MEGEKFWPLIQQHLIIQLGGVDTKKINSKEALRAHFKKFISLTNLDVREETGYNFTPFGATYGLILGASHLIAHTWPENGYIHIDLCLCSTKRDINKLEIIIKNIFNAKKIRIDEIKIPYPDFNPFQQPVSTGWHIN